MLIGGNLNDRTSTIGYIVYLVVNPNTWKSSKQRTDTWSSTEAEYRAFANTAIEVLWLKNLFHNYMWKLPKSQPYYMIILVWHIWLQILCFILEWNIWHLTTTLCDNKYKEIDYKFPISRPKSNFSMGLLSL